MNRRSALFVLLAAAVALTGSTPAPQTRDFEFTYTAKIGELPAGARQVKVWLPYPVSDADQEVTVLDIKTPVPHRIVQEPRFKNSILYLEVPEPGQEIAVDMKVRVERRESVRRPASASTGKKKLPAEAAAWLKPDRLVPIDGRIRELAREVTGGKKTDLEKARAIYDYVVDTMSYDKSGTGWGNGDIYWACDAKRGNCTDFHALFIGLNRAVGIPAKFEIGFPVPAERGEGTIGGYHCWSEFYLAGHGWVPVDASEARKNPEKRDYFFGALDANRVRFSIGRDIVLHPKQASEPLNYFIYPYVEVDGKPHSKVAKAFFYKDVS